MYTKIESQIRDYVNCGGVKCPGAEAAASWSKIEPVVMFQPGNFSGWSCWHRSILHHLQATILTCSCSFCHHLLETRVSTHLWEMGLPLWAAGKVCTPGGAWGASPSPTLPPQLEGPSSLFSTYWNPVHPPSLGRRIIPNFPSQNSTPFSALLSTFSCTSKLQKYLFSLLSILVTCLHACLPKKTGSILS